VQVKGVQLRARIESVPTETNVPGQRNEMLYVPEKAVTIHARPETAASLTFSAIRTRTGARSPPKQRALDSSTKEPR
jgi:hypothetical protein